MNANPQTSQLSLTGKVEKIVFKSPEGDFVIIRFIVEKTNLITAQGCLPDVVPGETIAVSGTWDNHPKFGKQFKIASYSKALPSDADGIEKYLASGLIKGIGPAFAERLVNKFGSQTLEIIDKYPEKLAQVDGVGPKRIEAIATAWQEQKEIANVMVFLKAKNVSTAFASKIYKLYGKQAIEKISENPYRLVEEVWGVGFKTADDLALKLGVEKQSPYRIKAGILHTMTEAMGDGHLYAFEQKVIDTASQLLEMEDGAALCQQAIAELLAEGKLVLGAHTDQKALALAQCYKAENYVAQRASWFAQASPQTKVSSSCVYDFLHNPPEGLLQLNEQQQKAILHAFEHRFSIITGGPGTGKTTLIRTLIKFLKLQNLNVKLAAPTGRAAKRMFESTGHHTETIHRLLEFDPANMGFKHHAGNVLDLDWLIIDEASMIDIFLFQSLIKAIPFTAHVILLGDVDQLPSVGPGNVLKDLINSGIIHVTHLKEIFRQAQDSMIVVNAHKINQSQFPSARSDKHDFFVIKRDTPEECVATINHIFSTTLPNLKIALDDAIVLAPMNRGVVGTTNLNNQLQQLLNPPHPDKHEIQRFASVYREGDRIMQIKNNYTKLVFNGDIGTIKKIDREAAHIIISYGERAVDYEFNELNELVLAYAISIHKSQGSEFKAVIIPIMMQHFMLLQKNLIYTAVTRAKNTCIIVGQLKALGMAINNTKESIRQTHLCTLLKTYAGKKELPVELF